MSAELGLLQREFARAVSDPEAAPDGAARLRSDLGISAEERLGVYANAYFARIHGVLRDDYGALAQALGEAGFNDLVRLYLMACPPRSFSLRFSGERLPEFLAGPVAEVFTRRWPFAADLARLEWALVDVFDAPDAALLERSALAELQPDDWPALRLVLAPAQRLLELAWPVQRLRDAWSADRTLPEIEAGATHVLAYRSGDSVAQRALEADEARALRLVGEGCDFAALCEGVAEHVGEAEAAPRVLALLERWLADGILAAQSPRLA